MKQLEWKQVKELMALLIMESDTQLIDDLADEISSIRYCIDMLSYGDTKLADRHIDIDFVFGEYRELREGEKPYQFIANICQLQCIDTSEKLELLLYKKE